MADLIEAYVGEYASGKSEVAVNRSLLLHSQGHAVTLVDLDLVEPTYTLRPLKRRLVGMGLRVIAWETGETTGLGEAGMVLHPEVRSVLRHQGSVVLDVGYGVYGSEVLNLVEGALQHPALRIYLVVNLSRPMTGSVRDVVNEARRFQHLDGVVNNTHLGQETTPQLVQQSALLVGEAAKELHLPVVATTAIAEVARLIGQRDIAGNPVWNIHRYLPDAFW